MSRKKKMHIKRYKYHQRPKEQQFINLLHSFKQFDEYMAEILSTFGQWLLF